MVSYKCGSGRQYGLVKGRLLQTATCVAMCVLVAGTCSAGNSTGFQWWSTAGLSVDLSDDWAATFEEELRVGDNLCYHHSEIGLTYKGLADWLEIGANFRKVYQRDSAGDWREEDRPHFNFTIKDTFAGIKWSNRSRFEWRDREGRDNLWRYRNRLKLELPWALTPLKIKPYASDEVLINMDGSGFSSNRLSAGGVIPIGKNIKLDLFYMWQATKATSGFDDIHALGTKLVFAF